jgi:hypothetical protein
MGTATKALAALVLVSLLAACGPGTSPAVPSPSATSAISPARYSSYGADPGEVRRLLGLADCGALVYEWERYDTARLKNAGPPAEKYKGYMTVAYDRMKELGCL